jgi:hypothetical protein
LKKIVDVCNAHAWLSHNKNQPIMTMFGIMCYLLCIGGAIHTSDMLLGSSSFFFLFLSHGLEIHASPSKTDPPIFISIRGCCLMENAFLKTIFQTFLCLFVIRKVGQRKTLSNQRKNWFDFQESVFFLFWAENTFQKL